VDLRVSRLRIAVLNTLNGVPTLPYIAVLSPGIARLARISADNLADDPEGGGDTGLIAAAITLNGEAAWIPDLDVLEGKVLEALA
jgi:hypothetical protein